MIYLENFTFPDGEAEAQFFFHWEHIEGKKAYDFAYPFKVLSVRGLRKIEFEHITVLYGGNGSGKSTALNVIAEKICAARDAVYNKTIFFQDYVNMCGMDFANKPSNKSRIITSDDVFDYMLNVRALNEGVDLKREELFEEYLDKKLFFDRHGHSFQMKSLEDYEELKRINQTKRKTQSRFVRDNLIDNLREYSNGESAYKYFTERIKENALYILDEPENSLSPKRQIELAGFIQEAVRFFGCQLIMSTHSPFFLAIKGAKIYDLDENPVAVKRWTELENVRVYHEFFKSHEEKF